MKIGKLIDLVVRIELTTLALLFVLFGLLVIRMESPALLPEPVNNMMIGIGKVMCGEHPQSLGELNELEDGVIGYYQPSTGEIVCFDKNTCLHEIGHKVDHENSNYSNTKEWKELATSYRDGLSPDNLDGLNHWIYIFPGLWGNPIMDSGWGGYDELYAEILEYSNGNPDGIPEPFRDSYPWERIWELQQDYIMEE